MTRIIFILSYPTYHSAPSLDEWLRRFNRDRRMPGLLAAMGVDVELWGLGHEPFETVSEARFGAPYRIRLFPPSNPGDRSRNHISPDMADAARNDPADLFVVIGTNGGAGYHLFDQVLLPDQRPFAMIIGGDYWSRMVPHARFVFPESALQEQLLSHPGWRLWRRTIPASRMERLPKSIDTDHFHPGDAAKRWDLIAVSRLNGWKNFDELGRLSSEHSVAVVGGGEREAELKRRFPKVDWLGSQPNSKVPALLHQARAYFHTGRREYFPRAIAEAMACGLPVIGFDDRFGPDVIPPECGLLVNDSDYREAVAQLLSSPDRIAAMARAAHAHVTAIHGPQSSEAACRTLIRVAEGA